MRSFRNIYHMGISVILLLPGLTACKDDDRQSNGGTPSGNNLNDLILPEGFRAEVFVDNLELPTPISLQVLATLVIANGPEGSL